jgi:hypothetical protein
MRVWHAFDLNQQINVLAPTAISAPKATANGKLTDDQLTKQTVLTDRDNHLAHSD